MRTLMLMLGVACLVAGCGKKPKEEAKNTNTGGGGGGDEFMAVDTGAGGRIVTGGGNQQPMQQPQPVPQQRPAGGNTNFQTGAGAVQNIRKAGLRTISLNEMKQLGLEVTQTADDLGRMPTAAEIKQMVQPNKTLDGMITDGTLILTNTANRNGLWAYEVDADTKGGIVLVAGTASRASADEVKQYLANK